MTMSRNLKTTYILLFVFSAVVVAWNTLLRFFSGVALSFITLVGIAFTIFLLSLSDKGIMKRIRDMFIICCAFLVLEIVNYFAFEFGWYSLNSLKGFIVYQNVLSCLAMVFFVYISFRYVFERANKKVNFVEFLLGNVKLERKPKKAKEISNGTLEEKPNKTTVNQEQPSEQEENIVIVETEE